MRLTIPFVLFTVVSFTLATGQSGATVINVPSEQPTIQDGVNAAVAGDTVLVANGVYTGVGNRDIDFLGKDIVIVSVNGPIFTTIDCQADSLDTHRAFSFINGESSLAELNGFTIIDGYTTDNGGALLCLNSSPTIRNCVFLNNSSLPFQFGGGNNPSGGAIFLSHSSSALSNCQFIGNTATDGGALTIDSSVAMTIDSCVFSSNYTTEDTIGFMLVGGFGGAIQSFRSSLTVTESSFSSNHSELHGGAISVDQMNQLKLRKCSFDQNDGDYGGGLFVNKSPTSIISCNFTGNVSTGLRAPFATTLSEGGGIYLNSSPSANIDSCIFIGNVSDTIFGGFEGIGAGIYCGNTDASITNCVFYNNVIFDNPANPSLGAGAALAFDGGAPTISNTLIMNNTGGEPVVCIGPAPTFFCTDIFANPEGNWTGCIAGQESQNGNFSLDPLFCDTTVFDLVVQGNSPLLPGDSCGSQIGLAVAGCGCCVTPGDADHNGTFNIADVTFGIARIFAGGSAPYCQDESDTNGDNSFNIADVTFGIARIFTGGSVPICGSSGF